MPDHAVAFAPGSIGNVGPGLDILGLAVAGAGDEVTLAWRDGTDLVVTDAGHPDLPSDPARHAAAIAATAVFRRIGERRGVALSLRKGLPLSGGQGGSAASAIAGAVAADHLAAARLDPATLLECALEAETAVAGRHADNLVPSLLGGLVLIRSLAPLDFVSLPVPSALRIVLLHPDQRLRTRDARAVLPDMVSRATALQQAANVAAMVAGACRDDLALFARAIEDRIAEPARAHLLPGFAAAKAAAMAAGALACSISGAGPTTFALADSDAAADAVAAAMTAAYRRDGIAAAARVTTADRVGARVR